MKKCLLLLFSVKALIGQFSSKWPGPNSSSFSAMRDSKRMCDIDNAMIIELICLL